MFIVTDETPKTLWYSQYRLVHPNIVLDTFQKSTNTNLMVVIKMNLCTE